MCSLTGTLGSDTPLVCGHSLEPFILMDDDHISHSFQGKHELTFHYCSRAFLTNFEHFLKLSQIRPPPQWCDTKGRPQVSINKIKIHFLSGFAMLL